MIARNAWRHYEDTDLLTTHYTGLVWLMDYFIKHEDKHSGLLDTSCYGDWVDISQAAGDTTLTPKGSVTAFYYVYGVLW